MKESIRTIFEDENTEVVHAFGITDVGLRRENNEDFFHVRPERRIFIVADGMGGHNAGEVASQKAAEAFDEYLAREVGGRMDSDSSSIKSLMTEAFHYANRQVNEMAGQNAAYKGMGCALIAAFMTGGFLHVCHVGDVRCYIINPSGIQQITNDHTLVARMVREGTMTPEQARTSSLRNRLTQAVGQMPALEPEYHTHEVESSDRVLLCSDGLWDMLSDSRIQEIVAQSPRIDDACRNLIAESNNAGGKDNITVVIFDGSDAVSSGGGGDEFENEGRGQ